MEKNDKTKEQKFPFILPSCHPTTPAFFPEISTASSCVCMFPDWCIYPHTYIDRHSFFGVYSLNKMGLVCNIVLRFALFMEQYILK